MPFPKTFMPLCKKILTRLFRVFVHVYIHHFDRIISIGAVSIITLLCYRGKQFKIKIFSYELHTYKFLKIQDYSHQILLSKI